MAGTHGPDRQPKVEPQYTFLKPSKSNLLSSRTFAVRLPMGRLSSYWNLLLVFIPVGLVSRALGWPAAAVFTLNGLAIIPLSPIINFVVQQLSARAGNVSGELCRFILGHLVEMIVSALWSKRIDFPSLYLPDTFTRSALSPSSRERLMLLGQAS